MRLELNGHSLHDARLAAWRILMEGRRRPKKASSPFASSVRYAARGQSGSRGA